jgi:hypothetical protein
MTVRHKGRGDHRDLYYALVGIRRSAPEPEAAGGAPVPVFMGADRGGGRGVCVSGIVFWLRSDEQTHQRPGSGLGIQNGKTIQIRTSDGSSCVRKTAAGRQLCFYFDYDPVKIQSREKIQRLYAVSISNMNRYSIQSYTMW